MGAQATQKLYGFTDEQIKVIERRIITFAKDNEFFDKLCHHVAHQKGSKTIQYRKVVKPKVDSALIQPLAEAVAPRPIKAAVETFEYSVQPYADRFNYTDEMVKFGYDDLVAIGGDTLADYYTQKLDYIKGTPFISSACTVTYATSILATLAKTAIVLKKNGAKPFNANGHYLAIVSPETLENIRLEIEAKGVAMSEATKEEVEKGVVGHYGRWDFMECPSDLLVKDASNHWMVCLGKTPQGISPITCAKMNELQVWDNPLGSGVIEDEDGNLTDDANRQRGSIAIKTDGLAAVINDDLCVIDIAVPTTTIDASDAFYKHSALTGYVSGSPVAEVNVVAIYNNSVVASPTITFKDIDNNSVSSSNLRAGNKYTVTAADASSHTASLTFVANVVNNFELTLA
jgi:N4-gp56 family major capsid protein